MNTNKIINISLRAIVLIVIAYFVFLFFAANNATLTVGDPGESAGGISDTLSPIDQKIADIDDSLPYYRYRKIKDSLEYIKQARKYKNTFLPQWNGWSGGHFNAVFAEDHHPSYYADPVKSFRDKEATDTSYYLSVADQYSLINAPYTVFRENGKNYLKYPVWDKINKNHKSGHFEVKEIPVAVNEFEDNTNHDADQKRTVYVPVSKKTYQTFRIISNILLLLLTLWGLYALFYLPIKILERIANGEAFTRKSIRALYIVSLTLLLFYLEGIFTSWIIRLFTANKVPAEFKFSYAESFIEHSGYIIVAIIVFAIARAFASGYKLQEEQSLTI